MGIFSKHKDKENASVNKENNSEQNVSLENNTPNLSSPPKVDLSAPQGVPKPPSPMSSLEDIKKEVAKEQPIQNQQNVQKEDSLPSLDSSSNSFEPSEQNSNTQSIPEVSKQEDEELFNFASDDLFAQSDEEEMTQVEPQTTQKSVENNVSEDEDLFNISGEFRDEPIDTHMEKSRVLSFEKSSSFRKNENENFFMTTQQFKAMVEIVDLVKNKVKEASDRHLRLLDIKSEEDVEFENLRKDFQYLEEKLYELDSTIFNN